MKNNKRSLFILKYLSEQTDENHLATILQINDYLQQYELDANRETISDCIKELQEVGYDIFCVRSTQNQYYMRERPFSIAEVKLLVDAVQSSRFVSKEQSIDHTKQSEQPAAHTFQRKIKTVALVKIIEHENRRNDQKVYSQRNFLRFFHNSPQENMQEFFIQLTLKRLITHRQVEPRLFVNDGFVM